MVRRRHSARPDDGYRYRPGKALLGTGGSRDRPVDAHCAATALASATSSTGAGPVEPGPPARPRSTAASHRPRRRTRPDRTGPRTTGVDRHRSTALAARRPDERTGTSPDVENRELSRHNGCGPIPRTGTTATTTTRPTGTPNARDRVRRTRIRTARRTRRPSGESAAPSTIPGEPRQRNGTGSAGITAGPETANPGLPASGHPRTRALRPTRHPAERGHSGTGRHDGAGTDARRVGHRPIRDPPPPTRAGTRRRPPGADATPSPGPAPDPPRPGPRQTRRRRPTRRTTPRPRTSRPRPTSSTSATGT